MAISTNGTVLARLAGALYNTQMSNATYKEVASLDPSALANVLYARDFSMVSDATVANTLVANLGLSSIAGLGNWIAAQLTAAGTSKGAKVVELLNGFAQMTADATYGAYATAFNANVDAALSLSQTTDNAGGSFAAAGIVSGKAFTFTAGLDVLNGTTGNDSFNAVLQGAAASGTTIAPGDVVNGGAGVDTLNISVAGSAGAAYTLSAVQTNAVEKVLLSQFDTDSGNSTTVAADLMNGLTTVGFSASGADGDTVFTGLKNIVGAEMRNGAADLTLTYNSTVVAGSADTQALTVSAVTGGTFTADGAETLAITSELAKSKVTNVASNTLKTITVSGAADLEITTALTATTIDASAATGALTVTLGAANQAVTGGASADVIDAGTNLTSADTINGGAGTDTLKISVGNATVAVGTSASKGSLYNVSNVEVIDVASTNDAATLDLDGASAVTTALAAANVGVFGVDGTTETTGDVVNFTLNGVAYTSGAVNTGNAAIDTYEEVVAAKINTLTGFSATAGTNLVTITNTSGASEAVEFGGMTITGTGTVATTGTTGYTNVSFVNLAATQSVDIYSADAVTASLKDASGTADTLSINLKTTAGDKGFNKAVGTITANNIETINLGATGMTDGKVTTVAALTGNAIKTLNITGDSDVTISAFTSSTALTTIDGSTSSGDLNLAAAPAAKDQSIKTGSGNDTINMGAYLTAADTIDGGGNNVPAGGTSTGSDKLTATGNIGTVTTPSALKIANVETIEIATGGAAATYIDATSITGAKSMAFSATSGTVKVTNLAAGVSIGLGENSNGFDGTMDVSLADATGATDAISFTTPSGPDADKTVALTIAAAVETVNIAATTSSANARTATFTNTNNAAKNIVLTAGHASDTVALGTLNAATTNVDASKLAAKLTVTTASTGAVTVAASGAVADNITTGAGADAITLAGKLGTTVQTINGGAGVDTLNATADNAATDFTSVTNIETINLTVGGNVQSGFNDGTKDDGLNSASAVNILGGDALSTFTVGTTAALDDDAAGTTMKFDASAFGGSIDIAVASDAFDAELSILGGASTTDKVTAIIAGTDNKVALMSGVETLVLKSTDNDTDASADLTNVTGLKTIDAQFVTNTNADQIKVDKVAAGVAIKTTSTKTGDNLVINLADVSGSADSLSLEVTTFTASGDVLNFDAAGIEVLNLSMKSSTAGKVQLDGVTATTGSTVTVNVSGTGTAELTSMASSITSVNSTGTGALKIAAADRTSAAMTITGGEGGDTVAMKNAGDVLDGGLGTDTLVISQTAILGGIEVNLSAADQVVSMNGSSNSAIQKGFESVDLSAYSGFGSVVTGSSGANTIVGTALADQITGGNGADTITGGAGADIIDLTETTAAADTVIYADSTHGGDTVQGFSTANDILSFIDNTSLSLVGTATKGFAKGAGTALGLGAADLAAANVIVITDAQATQTSAGITTLITTINSGVGTNIGDGVILIMATSTGDANVYYDATAAGNDSVLLATLTGVKVADLANLATGNFVVA
jgi:hypothetical protein